LDLSPFLSVTLSLQQQLSRAEVDPTVGLERWGEKEGEERKKERMKDRDRDSK
jgi:chaperone required for assembly of F1-ATPase